jgi:S-adenosylmethionine:tRNA ribosyltransferase-isomerase
MRLEDFDYNLPEHLIAQHPLKQRDACRLLVLDRRTGTVAHRTFRDIAGLLRPGDRLVLNDTRVLPARLFCRKGSGAAVELLFTEQIDSCTWKALAKPGRKARAGATLTAGDGPGAAALEVLGVDSGGERIVRLLAQSEGDSIAALIERRGTMPLPPYIGRPANADDRESFQTVYADRPGAVAAPTAGLHFTAGLLEQLGRAGIAATRVTLHVGIGTFLPVKVPDPAKHVMHEESYELSAQAAAEIMSTRRAGGRIIAVGTTVVRVLEHCAAGPGELAASGGRTSLMILPPYEFRIVDGIVTNFHLPMSTLIMLVCAFAGRERVLDAYAAAVREGYRFYSYGDAMVIS